MNRESRVILPRLFAPMKGCGFTAHYFTDNHNLSENRKDHSFRFSGHLLTFTTDNGVFSKTEIDEGTRILLTAVVQEGIHGSVLDLGCGYGVVGITLKKVFDDITVTAVDINPRAVELTRLNCQKNGVPAEVFVSNGFAQITGSFDAVITNPPIRAGKKVIYKMFEDAYAHLHENGVLFAVIRRKQGAESAFRKFEEVFGSCEVIAREKGYWVLKSSKLTD